MLTTDEQLKSLEKQMKLAEYSGEDRVVHSSDLLNEVIEENKKRVFYKTDFGYLDGILGGFLRGQVVIISAATGQGKTTYAQTLTEKFSLQGHKSLWFSYEVGLEEFMGKMPDEGKSFYLPKQLKQNSLVWLEQRIIESIAKHNTRVVFIDHLHYLLEMQKMAEAKSLSLLIGQMMRELKRIAREHDVLIFLISHMKKINVADKPELDDLRDSSFVAQEADIVLMLWRESKTANGEKFFTNITRVSVKKNRRTGNLGTVRYEFINGRFEEKEPVYQETNVETY